MKTRNKRVVSHNNTILENNYSDGTLEINKLSCMANQGLSIDGKSCRSGFKTYYIQSGLCVNLERKKLFKPGDFFVINEVDDFYTLYMYEDTDFLIHSINCEYFDEIEHKLIEMNNYLDRLQEIDQYTRTHSINVYKLAKKIGLYLGFTGNKLYNLILASTYHDIGKIKVPKEILNKESSFTKEEYEKIKEHVIEGVYVLKSCYSTDVTEIVYQHHERINGSGYPQGLKGNEIREEAKIIAICDSFDAMVSKRVYKDGISISDALKEIETNKGILFDPDLVDVFLHVYNKADIDIVKSLLEVKTI